MRDVAIRRINNYPLNFFSDLDSDFKRLFNSFENQKEDLSSFSPDFEIIERDGVTFISADLPGVKKEDLVIEFKEGHLILSGERKSSLKKNDYTEKRYGKFKRFFKLPKGLNAEKAEANFEDGILMIALPKEEEEKPKSIDIKIGEKSDLFSKLETRNEN